MISYQLKVLLALLLAVVFSLVFVILALIVPAKDKKVTTWHPVEKPKTRVGKIAQSMKESLK